SAVVAHLRSAGFAVTVVDSGPQGGSSPANLPCDYRDLSADELAAYCAVVLLAGHGSVVTCERDPPAAFANNVGGFVELVHKLRGQKFLFASTGSVYVQTGGRPAIEAAPLPPAACYYDLHKRQIEEYARLAYPGRHYALRLGTV